MGLGDELSFTVDAGVGALAGDLLLLLGDAARRRGRPTCVQGTWDGGGFSKGGAKGKNRGQQVGEGNGRIKCKEGGEMSRTKGESEWWRREGMEGAEGKDDGEMKTKRAEGGKKWRHGVIHGYKFNSARTTRNDLLNHTAATSNLNYCDKCSPG